MQITKRGERIVGIRTTYDAVKKRGVQSIVISFKSYLTSINSIELSDEKARGQLQDLRDDERKQLEEWLAESAKKMNDYSAKSALTGLTDRLEQAIEALNTEVGKGVMNQERADALYLKVRDFQQALKAAGYKRPKLSEV